MSEWHLALRSFQGNGKPPIGKGKFISIPCDSPPVIDLAIIKPYPNGHIVIEVQVRLFVWPVWKCRDLILRVYAEPSVVLVRWILKLDE